MTVSPLVTAYLADLDRALAGADPADRMEIVDSVREHIDAAIAELGADPGQAQIATVLRRLGSADTVAATWLAGAERPAPPAVSGTPTTTKLPTWATVLLVLVGIAVVGPVVVALVTVPLFLLPIRASTPGWLAAVLVAVLILGSIACFLVARRSARHRTAWTVAFVVGLVLAVPAAVAALGLGTGVDGGSSGGRVVEVGPVVEVIPTPSPLP